MIEIETLAKALAFEYYVGVVETRADITKINSHDALHFYTMNSEEYLDKAEKIFKLIADTSSTRH